MASGEYPSSNDREFDLVKKITNNTAYIADGSGGGGGGAVDSVNGKTGVVVLTASDVSAPNGSGTSTGTNTGDQTNITGNAGTASALSAVSALPNGTTATTQAIADGSTKVASTAYADRYAMLSASTVRKVYVSKGGNDANDGTFSRPFLTVAAAIASIGTTSTQLRYIVSIGPGRYDETTVTLKPWVWLVGDSPRRAVNISVVNPIGVDSTLKDASSICGMINIHMFNFVGITIDLSVLTGTAQSIIFFDRVTVDDHFVYTAKNTSDFVEMFDCRIWGEYKCNGGVHTVENIECEIGGGFTGTAPVDLSVVCRNSWFSGNCSFTNSGANAIGVELYGCVLPSNIGLTKSSSGGVSCIADVVSIPAVVNITGGETFTPNSSAKWLTGTTTNDTIQAGLLGEYISSLKAIGSPQSLSNNTAANITSISLTAGDWDVEAIANFTETTSTVTARTAGINTTSATLPTDGSEGYNGVQSTVTSETNSITLSRKRVSVASTTTVYLVGKAVFSAGTVGGFGSLNARRVR